MKIRSAVPENGCLVFFWRMEKTKKQKRDRKKQKKTSVKHICIRLIGGCVNKLWEQHSIQKTAVVNYVRFGGKRWHEDWVWRGGRIVSSEHQLDQLWVDSDQDSVEQWSTGLLSSSTDPQSLLRQRDTTLVVYINLMRTLTVKPMLSSVLSLPFCCHSKITIIVNIISHNVSTQIQLVLPEKR